VSARFRIRRHRDGFDQVRARLFQGFPRSVRAGQFLIGPPCLMAQRPIRGLRPSKGQTVWLEREFGMVAASHPDESGCGTYEYVRHGPMRPIRRLRQSVTIWANRPFSLRPEIARP